MNESLYHKRTVLVPKSLTQADILGVHERLAYQVKQIKESIDQDRKRLVVEVEKAGPNGSPDVLRLARFVRTQERELVTLEHFSSLVFGLAGDQGGDDD